MKQFIKYIVLFSSVILLLGGSLEYMLHQPPNMYKFKKALIEQKSQQIETIIIGSSVVNHGLNPSYMDKNTFNLAVSGEWTRFNKMFLQRYFSQLTGLKRVIWGQCYHSLWMDDTPEFSEKSVVYHKLYLDIRAENDWSPCSELISLRAVALRKWSNYYITHKNTMNCDSLGIDHSFDSDKSNPSWKQDVPALVREQTNRMRNDKRHLYQQNLDRVKEVAAMCQQRGIELVIVLPPVYHEFYQLADKEQVHKVDEGFNHISNQYKNVRYFNYLADDRFTDLDFYDGNHLNSDVGAVKFSQILAKDLTK